VTGGTGALDGTLNGQSSPSFTGTLSVNFWVGGGLRVSGFAFRVLLCHVVAPFSGSTPRLNRTRNPKRQTRNER